MACLLGDFLASVARFDSSVITFARLVERSSTLSDGDAERSRFVDAVVGV